MKGGKLYMAILFVFFVFVFLMEYRAPHKFSWNPTYDRHDKEPFGSYVFDDIVSSSIDSYTVTYQTLYQVFTADSTASPRAFLLTEDYPKFNETDVEYVLKLLQSGNQVMICAKYFPFDLEDTLCFETNTTYYGGLIWGLQKKEERDSIFFGTDTLHPERIFEVYPEMHPTALVAGTTTLVYDTVKAESVRQFNPINCDSMQMLVWDKRNRPLAIRAFIGKGELFLVTTPLMFTNYSMLDGVNASYVFKLLSFLSGKPLIRVEAYGDHGDQSQSPLRYILSESSLRRACYWMLALLLLFMFFTAKRRQRIIPVVKSPPNRIFGFMQLISNLYFQRHDNVEMLKMKYTYFCAEVKSLIGIDLQENIPNEPDSRRLAEKTGMENELTALLLKNIRIAIYRSEVDDLQLKQYIDGMNDLLRALKT